jgi:hypothetical protein
VLGPTLPETRKILRKLLAISQQGNRQKFIRLTLFYAGLGILVVAVAARVWLGLIVAGTPFILIWWMDIRTATPPIALILGKSTLSYIRFQRSIKDKLSPLRVISLLDVEVIFWDTNLTNEMLFDCYRTTN